MVLPPPPADPRETLKARLAQWLDPVNPPAGWAGIPARIVGFVKGIPAAAWIFLFVLTLLVMIVLVAWWRFHDRPVHAPWSFEFGWPLLVLGLLIAAVVPYLVVRALALWRVPIGSEFDELDRAWRAGVAALEREGIDPRSVPTFLLLGSPPLLRERNLLESADREVKRIGPDDGPFTWYAGRDVLYLSLRGVGVTGSLAGPVEPRSIDDGRRRHRQLVRICRLLARRRLPVCAANGVLVVAGFGRVVDGEDLEGSAAALRSDLRTIQRETGVRAPVTLLLDGLEAVPGFAELVRRLGRQRTARQRFGHRFELGADAHREDLVRLSDHVCGAFEEWVHLLFREQRVLERSGNRPLYALVSRVRRQLADRLGVLLGDGIGFDPDFESPDDAIPFSGCYVAGTTESGDRWAFARGVLEKQIQEENLVEWTPPMLARLGWRRLALRTAAVLSAALTVSLVVLVVAGIAFR